jgi:integrase
VKWEEKVIPQHKASSQSTEKSVLRHWLVPHFGNLQLKEINTERIQDFISTWKEAPKTLQNVLAVMRLTWATAKAWSYVTGDPFQGLVMPEMVSEEQPCFTDEQMRRIISKENDPWQTFFWLASETGMRTGELLGLCPEDIDITAKLIKVRRSIWNGKAQTTKTKRGVRTYILSSQLCARLAEFIRANPGALVFHTSTGAPWDAGNVRRHLYALLEKLGIPQAGMHAFRHGNSTVMAQEHISPKLRQQRLGHADDRMMMRYEHTVTAEEVNLANRLGEMFAPAA